MGKVLAFVSGKGGTGKTSMCAAIATCLAAQGQQVLCMDLDIGLRNLDLALGVAEEPLLPFTGLMDGSCTPEELAPCGAVPNLRVLTAPVTAEPESIDRDAFTAMVAACKERYDFCLLDAPAGIGAGFRLCVAAADEIIVVTGGEPAALRDGARAASLLPDPAIPAQVLVNRVSKPMYRRMVATVDDVMDAVGLPLLGIVPEDCTVTLAAAAGQPLILESRRGAAAACLRISRRLLGQNVPLRTR